MDAKKDATTPRGELALFGDVAGLIDGARTRAAIAANSELVMLYWSIGKRIREDVLGGERAAYGQDVVKRLAMRLTERYGRGYSWRNLFRMVSLAELYPSAEILSTLSTILGWSHFAELMHLSEQAQRDFYVTAAARERWSVRTLRERIESKLYERTLAAGGAPLDDAVGLADAGTTEPALMFRDPYVLDFLGLAPEHSEAGLERAILDDMQRFLLELGVGFAFVERQKRMIVDGRPRAACAARFTMPRGGSRKPCLKPTARVLRPSARQPSTPLRLLGVRSTRR